ncbi:non-ribosomal peptide synthetase [Mycobacteroides immunogenum]|nr:non-ribosomal peptide synthetase [Mycobacteroides immunogenum]
MTEVIVESGRPAVLADRRDTSLYQLFVQCVGRHPQHVAVRLRDEALTYTQLHAHAESMAARLLQLGVRPGDTVALSTVRSVQMVVGIWAILRIGGTYVPIDPALPPRRIQAILRESGARVCLTAAMIRVEDDDGELSELPPLGPPLAPAYVMYTSGSTGTPKGIAIAHHCVTRTVISPNYVAITPEDNVLQLVNYAFDGSVFDIFGALLNGATLVLSHHDDATNPERLASVIDEYAVTVALITTALFNAYVDIDPAIFAPLRKVLFGGERASAAHVNRALNRLGPGKLVNVYGPTEATVFTTTHTVDEPLDEVPIGKPLPDTRLYVLDSACRPTAAGVPGELYIGGEGIGYGYWRNPRLTSQRFVPEPDVPGALMFRSGDLVERSDDGELIYRGRIDDQIKLRGFRIEPGEIESRLQEHSLVKQCAVVVSGERLVAHYTGGRPVDDTELKDYLRETLPHYMIPDHLAYVAQLPLTPNGKIDRQRLAEQSATPGSRPCVRRMVGSEREEVMYRLFADVLHVPDVGPHECFSDMGGNSIVAMTLASRLTRAGYPVTAREILHHQTIDALLTEMSDLAGGGVDSGTFDAGGQPVVRLDGDVPRFLDESLAGNGRLIGGTPVVKEYALTAMQELQIGFDTAACFAMEPLRRPLDLPALRKAYGNLIAQHGLLRSMPIEGDDRHLWREHDYRAEDPPRIPIIDATNYAATDSALPALIEELSTRIYSGSQLLHQLAVVRVDGDQHLLAWIVSHVIFDQVSQEILSRHLIRHYDAVLQGRSPYTEAPSFEDYVHQLARGPRGLDVSDVVRTFRLEEFHRAKQSIKPMVATTGSLSATNFTIVVPLRSAWQKEHPLDVALGVHAKGLQSYLHMDELPLLFVTNGRQYENRRYYDTVGEFTDMVPMLVDARASVHAITQSIVERLELATRHNVNFLHLMLDPEAQAHWPDIGRLMDVGEDFADLDTLMFNFLGEVAELPADSLAETSWTAPHPLPIQTLLNGITAVCSDTLLCTFRTSCAVDVPRIRACFAHAAAELP